MLDPMAMDYIEFINPYLKLVKDWKLHFCIIPRRCRLTDKTIWLKHCYIGTRLVKNINIVEKWYVSKEEFVIWKIKQ
jgi:hypothetical protein